MFVYLFILAETLLFTVVEK